MSEPMMWLLVRGVWETLAMTFVSGFFGFVIGLPVGVLLYVTRPGQIIANAKLYRTVSAIVNIFRSIPFIDWFAGSDCSVNRWWSTVYCPYGRERSAGDPNRVN